VAFNYGLSLGLAGSLAIVDKPAIREEELDIPSSTTNLEVWV